MVNIHFQSPIFSVIRSFLVFFFRKFCLSVCLSVCMSVFEEWRHSCLPFHPHVFPARLALKRLVLVSLGHVAKSVRVGRKISPAGVERNSAEDGRAESALRAPLRDVGRHVPGGRAARLAMKIFRAFPDLWAFLGNLCSLRVLRAFNRVYILV